MQSVTDTQFVLSQPALFGPLASLEGVPQLNTQTSPWSRYNLTDSRTTIRRLEATTSSIISPIERWPDENYAPQALRYATSLTRESFRITTPLHRFDPDQVRVDLNGGRVIVLLSADDRAETGQVHEYYCEVPIPEGVAHDTAYVQTEKDSLTVSMFVKKDSSGRKRFISDLYWIKNVLARVFPGTAEVWHQLD